MLENENNNNNRITNNGASAYNSTFNPFDSISEGPGISRTPNYGQRSNLTYTSSRQPSRNFNHSQNAPQNKPKPVTNNKNIKNVNVKKENVKKHKNKKFSLKKIIAIGTVVVGLSTGIFFGANKNKKVQIPDGFESSGIVVETDKLVDNIDSDFALIKLNNWKSGISDNSVANIKFCEENSVPYGIIIESNAKTKKEAKADAACVNALLEGRQLSYPVYYDITDICNTLDEEHLITISEAFTEGVDGAYKAGVCIDEDYLVEHDAFECEKLIVSSDEEINYTGDYNMCYFSRSDQYYSNKNINKKIVYTDENGEDNIKGIDISQYQGDIDWSEVQKQDVNFVIMRFSSFYKFHDGADLDIDDKFYENVAACEALGIPYGIYCYSTATTVAEAKLEAKTILEVLEKKGISPELPIYYDAEMEYHFNNPKETAELTKAFCEEIESKSHRAGLYASYSLIKDMIYVDPSLKNMDKWVASYKYNEKRNYDEVLEEHIPDVSDIGKYNAVQVTDKALLDGIDANTVDVNFANDSIGKVM